MPYLRMTNFPSEAVEALHTAESRLQELIASAAHDARYDDVATLAAFSSRLRALIAEVEGDEDLHSVEDVTRSTESSGEAEEEAVQPRPQVVIDRKRKVSRSAYPRFCKQGDQLVKIGWSSSANRNYEHKVSFDGIVAVVDHLAALPNSKFPVTAETIVESLREADDTAILGYQVYVVVAWLRAEGLLVPHGRHGFSKSADADLSHAVRELWESLAACSV